ncbi:hypothetical protein HDU96_001563 [Phlyctochytrium bullatum]|nr:hypothetical protein HDU96_001563 [Phlyctochytrium bullatum]
MPSKKIFLMVSNRTITIDKENDDKVEDLATLVADTPHEPWIYPNTPHGLVLPMYEEDGYRFRVMVCGGVQKDNSSMSSNQCYSLEPEAPNAKWTRMPDMPRGRVMPDSVLLPDGTVLFTNGARWGIAGGNAGQAWYASGPWYDADLFNPATNTWTAGIGRSQVPRLYHSGAILLEDATVITTGSEMSNYQDVWGATEDTYGQVIGTVASPARADCWPMQEQNCTDPYETRVEHFTPPYLKTDAKRPVIKSAPASSGYNGTLVIEVDPSVKVGSVAFLRYTTTTHSTNTDQRFLGPKVLFNNGTHVIVRTPPSSAVAPPGNYHVFVVTVEGVPSVASRLLMRSTEPVRNDAIPAAAGSTTTTGAATSTGAGQTGTGSVTVTASSAPAPSSSTKSAAGVGAVRNAWVWVAVAALAGVVVVG